MKVAVTTMLALGLCSASLLFAQTSAPSRAELAAGAACERAQGEQFGHPSNGCWVAHDAALARGDHARALSYARTGCQKYGRGDHCLYVAAAEAGRSAKVVPVGATSTAAGGAEALARGARMLNATDYEDAEHGVLVRQLRETRAARHN